MKEMERKL